MKHRYETIGGTVTRGETIAKIMDHLKEIENSCYVISHLHMTDQNHDRLLAQGWRAWGEMFGNLHTMVQKFATRGLQ